MATSSTWTSSPLAPNLHPAGDLSCHKLRSKPPLHQRPASLSGRRRTSWRGCRAPYPLLVKQYRLTSACRTSGTTGTTSGPACPAPVRRIVKQYEPTSVCSTSSTIRGPACPAPVHRLAKLGGVLQVRVLCRLGLAREVPPSWPAQSVAQQGCSEAIPRTRAEWFPVPPGGREAVERRSLCEPGEQGPPAEPWALSLVCMVSRDWPLVAGDTGNATSQGPVSSCCGGGEGHWCHPVVLSDAVMCDVCVMWVPSIAVPGCVHDVYNWCLTGEQ